MVNGKPISRRRDVLEMILRHQREAIPVQWFELQDGAFITVYDGHILMAYSKPEPQPWYRRIFRRLFQ